MPNARTVVITRSRAIIALSRDGEARLDPEDHALLTDDLQYVRRRSLHGREAWATGEYCPTEVRRVRLYGFDGSGRLYCPRGFLDRAIAAYRRAGYSVRLRDYGPVPPPSVLEPRLAALADLPFRPRQRDCVDAVAARIARGRGGIIKAVTGFGKAQPVDSLVQTPSGPARMGDIRVGDEICHPDGGTTRVVGVHPQGVKDVFRLRFRDGASVLCCGDHLWEVIPTGGSRKRRGTPRVVDTWHLRDAVKYRGPSGRTRYAVRVPRPLAMGGVDAPARVIDPYNMGVLLGNGGLTAGSPGFTSSDGPTVLRFASNLPAGMTLSNTPGSLTHRAVLAANLEDHGGRPNPYKVDLVRLGLYGLKSTEKFIPDEYLHAGEAERWELLRGLMDTDGSITERGAAEYTTSSPGLARDFAHLVESLGGIASVKVRGTTHADSHRFSVRLPDTSEAFHLPRKKSRSIPRTKYLLKRILVAVEPAGRSECRCITVEARDGLYLTDHCVVTHNSHLLLALCLLYPKARVVITCPDEDNTRKTFDFLSQSLASVGQIGGGRAPSRSSLARRVRVVCMGSLHHIDDCDLLFADEVHRYGADDPSYQIARLSERATCFGLSATPYGRSDGASPRLEGLFGPTIFELGWEEATELGLVVPVEVHWSSVPGTSPAPNVKDRTAWYRAAIWRNETRNRIVARDAASYADDVQVLVMTYSVEHLAFLSALLPDFEVVYSLSDDDRLDAISQIDGLPRLEPMTPDRRYNLRKAFEGGQLRKAIANDVWSTGVSFDALSVLVRADAMGNDIRDEQIPGRVVRIHASSGKEVGLVRDFLDEFDPRAADKARRRRANYLAKGWAEVRPGGPRRLRGSRTAVHD